MSTTFVQVGSFWVNLDQVNGVEMIQDSNDPTKLIAARVHYANGKSQDFTVSADIQSLVGWLRTHKAP
jgi:hypothetical protein